MFLTFQEWQTKKLTLSKKLLNPQRPSQSGEPVEPIALNAKLDAIFKIVWALLPWHSFAQALASSSVANRAGYPEELRKCRRQLA